MNRSFLPSVLLFTLALLFAFAGGPAAAFGQGVTTSGMTGTVTDQAGAPLPGANVLAVHQPSGARYGTTTGEEGTFNLRNMRVGGPYRVAISFVGYQAFEREGVQLSLGETYELSSVTLREAATQLDEVQVTAEGNVLAADRTGLATNISERQIETAPSVGRDLADFVRLTPQVYVANDDDDGAAISVAGQNNRYNSIFIDGAVSNDVFGLSAQGTDGGQTGATPISLDAIEEFQVNISPYDVSQSGFTGAAINAVTRSGSNEFSGSAAYFRRGDEFAQDLPAFGNNRYVARLGGPIVEDKLFFFVNGDFLRSETPQPVSGDFSDIATRDALSGLRQLFQDNLGYDPGAFLGKASSLESDKLLAKLDWNASQNHKFVARYSYSGSDNVDAFQTSENFVNFANTAEVFPNRTHNATLEWNGSFGSNIANKTILSYKSVSDDRGVQGEPFPTIEVSTPSGGIQLGTERYSQANVLEQDVVTFTNNFDWFLEDHTITFGTHNEFYSLANLFAVFNYGLYEFDSIRDLRQTVCASATGTPSQACNAFTNDGTSLGQIRPAGSTYQRGYSLVDDDPSTPEFEETTGDQSEAFDTGAFNAYQIGFYVQDEWKVSDRLELSGGLRVDFPSLTTDPVFYDDAFDGVADGDGALESTLPAILEGQNVVVGPGEAPDDARQDVSLQSTPYDGYDLGGARPGEAPGLTPHWSPRLGFNLDLTGEGQTQVRGGTGVFTSRVPFVWPGGTYLNNGVRTGFLYSEGPAPLRRPEDALNPTDSEAYGFGFGQSRAELAPSGRLEMFADDFKYPRVWRSSLAVDQELPYGFVGTFEGQYTRTLQNVLVTNVNLKPANATLDGPDDRPIWVASQYENGSVYFDPRYDNIHKVGTTSEGYSYTVTGRLRKQFTEALLADVSYTYGDAFAVNDGTSSQINSLWDGVEHVRGANNLELSRSDFSTGHRILASATYRAEFLDNLATTVNLTYIGESGRPFSYIIGDSDDLVGEQGDENSLFYVPTEGELAEGFVFTTVDDGGNAIIDRSAQEQRQDVGRFISGSDYLAGRRGGNAERNAERTPFESVVDLSFTQEVFGQLLGTTHRGQITLSVFNFSSMLGEVLGADWGERYFGSSQRDVVNFEGFCGDFRSSDAPAAQAVCGPGAGELTPVYTSALGETDPDTEKADLFNTIEDGRTYSSQWQLQLGFRYTF